MKRLIILSLVCLLNLAVFAAAPITYYVSYSTGNDNNTAAQAQSPNTPWKTMGKVLTGMSSGTIVANSIVYFKRGDAWLMPANFIVNRGITFDQYGPGNIKPYFTALTSVPGSRWTLKDATLGVWETTDTIQRPPSNTLNLVVINGTSYAMGRTPNANATNKGWLNYEAHTSTSVTDNESPFTSAYVGGQIVVRTTHTNIERGTISSITGTTLNFSTTGFHTPLDANNGWGYFVQNNLKCVDQFGEWFYNTSTKKLSVCVGPLNNPGNFNVQYPYLDTVIQIRASNVYFNNLQFTGANKYMCWNDWSGLKDNWFTYCDFNFSGGDFIYLHGKTHSGVIGCTATNANSNAFAVAGCNGYYIYNTKITKIAKFAGMLLPNSSVRYGHGIFASDPVNVTDTGLIAHNNAITDIGYAGIFLGGDNNTIYNNYIDTVCSVQDDGANIYIGNYAATGTTPKVLKGNLFYGNLLLHSMGAPEGTPGNATSPANNWGYGMYFDDNSNHATAIYNTIAYANGGGIFLHNANHNRIENNLSFANENEQLYMQDDGIGDSIYLDTIRYNTLMPVKASQLVYYWALDNTAKDSKNFNTWGLIDNNILAMPFSTNVAKLNHFGGVLFATYPLASWRSTWSNDLVSTGMPLTVRNGATLNTVNVPYTTSSADDIVFTYNTNTAEDKTLYFPCNSYIDITNNTYFNSVLLKPTESKVLLLNKF